jgi:hydroxybutyrate-dimer hydrolase
MPRTRPSRSRPAVAVTFANALARASVKDHLCGFSYAATATNRQRHRAGAGRAGRHVRHRQRRAALSGVKLINNLGGSLGRRATFLSANAAGVADWNLDGALCLREPGHRQQTPAPAPAGRHGETQRNGNLRGKPTIIVHGRDDALLPVNHTSRPYYALNKKVEGAASRLSYIEVTNAQHFDGFIGLPAVLPGYDSRYVPLHVYLNRALDAVYDHLQATAGAAAQPGGAHRAARRHRPARRRPSRRANVPPFAAAPAAGNAITITGGNTS